MESLKKPLGGVVKSVVGSPFDIYLQSMAGSTGYAWYLSGLPDGVVLLSTRSEPIHGGPVVGPTRQIFNFVGVEEVKDEIEFKLLAPWKPTEPADQAAYKVDIRLTSVTETDELEAEIGSSRFAARSAHLTQMGPIIPYGFPTEANLKKGGVIVPLYGFPPWQPGAVLREGCTAEGVVESAANCVVEYGVPWGIANQQHCTLKYGFPVNLHGDANDVLLLYGFPPHQEDEGQALRAEAVASGAARSWEVVEDKDNCLIKYGVPGGIGSGDDCTMKYGFPRVKE